MLSILHFFSIQNISCSLILVLAVSFSICSGFPFAENASIQVSWALMKTIIFSYLSTVGMSHPRHHLDSMAFNEGICKLFWVYCFHHSIVGIHSAFQIICRLELPVFLGWIASIDFTINNEVFRAYVFVFIGINSVFSLAGFDLYNAPITGDPDRLLDGQISILHHIILETSNGWQFSRHNKNTQNIYWLWVE